MTNFVQLYKSTDTNAPVLSGTVSALVNLLNKCLVDGYTTATVTSISRSSSTATVTISANATLVTGNYVTISGAVETDYNGTFLITVVNSTTFTYTVPNTPSTPATGTISYAKASLGWSKPYTGTNAAVYRSLDSSSNQFYLQVIDNAATAGSAREAQVVGYESMTAYGVGTRPFPNLTQYATNLSVRKSTTADATARAWTLIGDDRTFYLVMATADTSPYHLFAFGHFISFRSGDSYNTFISGEGTFNSGTAGSNLCCQYSNAYNSLYVARNFASLPTTPLNASAITVPYCAGATNLLVGAGAGMALPNGADTGYYVLPMYVYETTGYQMLRGRFPGYYCAMQVTPIAQYETMTNVNGLSGVTLTGVSISNTSATTGLMLFDTFGPWN